MWAAPLGVEFKTSYFFSPTKLYDLYTSAAIGRTKLSNLNRQLTGHA